MEKFIKYKRIIKNIYKNNEDKYDTQDFFDELITNGWEIIFYNEKEEYDIDNSEKLSKLKIMVIVGKKQNNILNNIL